MASLVLALVFVLVGIAIFVFPAHPKKTICFLFGMMIVLAIMRSAIAGAPIPVDPHYVVLEYRIPSHNTCLPTWTQNKMYRCDRAFTNGFEP